MTADEGKSAEYCWRWALKGRLDLRDDPSNDIKLILASIYNEIGPGDRIALSKLAAEFFEKTGRPLRLAIDISIWLFQIQAGEGGTNPALRTFYYRILRLIYLSIHPVFVFDGPNKPPLKRNKRTLPPGVKTASIPEFLAKQLLKHFGLPIHLAPGEAEAECVLLQRQNVVDAVLSEDADTLMFGSGLTLRNLSPEGSLKTKAATHVNVYDAEKVKAGCGLDRQGMILVALMSGGDYIPEGIPGCGPRTACQAARAGFGSQLCQLNANDHAAIKEWKSRLTHELHSNESKFFSRKHSTLEIPEDFPRMDVLRFYTDPCISSDRRINEEVRDKLEWDREIDFQSLRTFAGDAFEWFNISGAKKFIRNLAPALLVKELRLRGSGVGIVSDNPAEIEAQEARLIKRIHLRRNHVSTDQTTELRVGFVPLDLVPLDLGLEPPDPETTDDILSDKENDIEVEPSSPKKKRGPSTYDPTQIEKIWILETFIRIGVPLRFQDWEESFRNAQKYEATKASNRRQKPTGEGLNKTAKGGKQQKMLDPYVRHAKPVASIEGASTEGNVKQGSSTLPLTGANGAEKKGQKALPQFKVPKPLPDEQTRTRLTIVELLSSPEKPPRKRASLRPCADQHVSSSTGKDSDLNYSHTVEDSNLSEAMTTAQLNVKPISESPPMVLSNRSPSNGERARGVSHISERSTSRTSKKAPMEVSKFHVPASLPPVSIGRPFQTPVSPPKCPSTPSRRQKIQKGNTIDLCSSPNTPNHRQRSITEWATPQKLVFRCRQDVGESKDVIMEEKRQDEVTSTESSQLVLTSNVSESQRHAKPGAVIRLRESLEGTWCLEDGRGVDNANSESHQGSGNKRKRTGLIRKSQVMVVDLTEA